MTFEAHVSDNFMIDGVNIYISERLLHGRRILKLRDHNTFEWQDHEPLTAVAEPTLALYGEMARALADGLTRFYGGLPELTTTREDLLHERGRVDKLTDALVTYALMPGRHT